MVRIFSVGLTSAVLLLGVVAPGQTAKPGIVKALADIKFESDDSKCLRSATETGDPSTGPSTLILKAAPGCKVRWHYHTAEEQLIVTQGSVLTEMEGMLAATLRSGGFAMIPGNVKHRFSCESKTDCIMFVSFDRKYDIFWVNDDSKSSGAAK